MQVEGQWGRGRSGVVEVVVLRRGVVAVALRDGGVRRETNRSIRNRKNSTKEEWNSGVGDGHNIDAKCMM